MTNSEKLKKAIQAIETFDRDLQRNEELQSRLSRARGFYVLEEEGKETMFAWSLFVRCGVKYDPSRDGNSLTEHYVRKYKSKCLLEYCSESDLDFYFRRLDYKKLKNNKRLKHDLDEYDRLFDDLVAWMGADPYNKIPFGCAENMKIQKKVKFFVRI